MTITVEGPGGATVEFPDGTAAETINKAMTDHFGGGKKDEPSGVVAGAAQGLAGLISGPASTGKRILGMDTSAMAAAAEKVAPKDYKSAPVLGPDSHWYDPTSYNWKNVPQMLAENAPQMAESIAAAKVGAKVHPLVGLAAGAVPFAVNALGDTAKNAAVNRTGDTAAEPDKADKLRAAGTVAAQSIPQMLAISRFMPGANKVTQVGVNGAVRSGGKAGVTTAIEGGTGAAQEAIGQVGATLGTPGGVKLDPGAIAEQGVGNAILGGGFAAPKMASNALGAAKYRKFGGDNAAATETVANRIKDAADGANLKYPKAGFSAVRQAHEDTITELKTAAKAAGTSSPDTEAAIKRATKGRELTDADLNELQTNSTPDVARLAREAHVTAMLKGMGDYQGEKFIGGVTHGIGKHIRAYNAPISAGASAALGAATGGGHAASLFAYSPETLSALAGAYAAVRGVDALTGNRSPANKFVDKFGTDTAIPGLTPPQQPPAPPPQTTSVPQVAPPSAPAQPWGAPTPAPTPIDASALNTQVKAAFEKYAARKKWEGVRQANTEAADSAAINAQGGLDALSNPALGKRAKELLGNADALKRLRANPEEEAAAKANAKAEADMTIPSFLPTDIPSFLPKRTAPVAVPEAAPAVPASPQPTAPEGPSITELINRMRARYPVAGQTAPAPVAAPEKITKKKGKVKEQPLADTVKTIMRAEDPAMAQRMDEVGIKPVYEDNPYPQKVADKPAPRDHVAERKKLTSHEAANSSYDLTNEYVPLQDHELRGKHWTHEEFAKSETADKLGSGELEQDNAQKYHDAVVMDRKKRERVLQELSQSSVSENDTPALKALLDQLHHIRRGSTAKAAIYHYASLMSTPMRAKVLKRLDSSFVHSMWSKEK